MIHDAFQQSIRDLADEAAKENLNHTELKDKLEKVFAEANARMGGTFNVLGRPVECVGCNELKTITGDLRRDLTELQMNVDKIEATIAAAPLQQFSFLPTWGNDKTGVVETKNLADS